MNLRRLPLWLYCDVIAFAGVMVSFWSYVAHSRQAFARLAASGGRRMDDGDFGVLAHLLAAAEAILEFALMRRAFQLAGLDPWRVALIERRAPVRHLAFCRRVRIYLDRCVGMDAAANRMARRIAKLVAASPFAAADHRPAALALRSSSIENPLCDSATPPPPLLLLLLSPFFPRRFFPQRIRAPPWLAASPANQPAPARRSTCENENSCLKDQTQEDEGITTPCSLFPTPCPVRSAAWTSPTNFGLSPQPDFTPGQEGQ